MALDCMSLAQASAAMPLDRKFDGPGINSEKFEGPEAPNVGPR